MSSRQFHRICKDDSQIFKEDHYVNSSSMEIRDNRKPPLANKTVSSSGDADCDATFAKEHSTARATSPLDTIAEVACRIDARTLPNKQSITHNRTPSEIGFPEDSPCACMERGNESPASTPTQETMMSLPIIQLHQKEEGGYGASVPSPSLLTAYRSSKMESFPALLQPDSKDENNNGHDETRPGKTKEHVSKEKRLFKNDVVTHLVNVAREVNRLKAHVALLDNKIESMESERSQWKCHGLQNKKSGGCPRQEHRLTMKPEDSGQVCFTLKQMQNRAGDEEKSQDQEIRITGNVLRISAERRCADKDASASNERGSVDGEKEVQNGESRDELEIAREPRKRVIGDESTTRTDSGHNSENSDWRRTADGNKRMKVERGSGKAKKGKGVRRRRDNWTEAENKLFMGMVVENRELEEMTLRRMLARKFAPRRTHEQCANHLRILRAQKRLPPALEEGVTKRA